MSENSSSINNFKNDEFIKQSKGDTNSSDECLKISKGDTTTSDDFLKISKGDTASSDQFLNIEAESHSKLSISSVKKMPKKQRYDVCVFFKFRLRFREFFWLCLFSIVFVGFR